MQKTQKATAVKWGLAAASALALALGGIAPAAFAADIQVGPGDVEGFEVGGTGTEDGFNYDEWHIGSYSQVGKSVDDSLAFGECLVTTKAHETNPASHIQLLKGFDPAARPFAGVGEYGGDGTVDAVANLINSTSIKVVTGNVTIQLPVFLYDGLAPEPRTPEFTTVRSVLLAPGTYQLADLKLEDSQDWFGSSPTVAEFLENMQYDVDDDTYFEILGVGFTGSAGAQVEYLSFGGNTYYFGTGSCLPANPTPPSKVDTGA